MEYTADYPLNWNPLMINHDPAYIYTLDKNNSKHIQLNNKQPIFERDINNRGPET